MKRFTLFLIAVLCLCAATYYGHGTEHIQTTDGKCFGRNHYELLWVHDPISNPFVIEECKP